MFTFDLLAEHGRHNDHRAYQSTAIQPEDARMRVPLADNVIDYKL